MNEHGSILLEQILAVMLLSVFVVGLFSLLTVGSLGAQMAQEFSLAGALAAQKLEEIAARCEEPTEVARKPLDPARFPRYEWQVNVGEATQGLRQVTVTVWWPQRRHERGVSLTTLVRCPEDR